MHEMAIARNIVNIAVAAAEKEGAKRITKVNVVAGELRGIIPAQLIFSFGLMSENTIASGAYLDLEIMAVMGKCKKCGETFVVRDYRYACSRCQSEDIQTLSGTELRVKDIEVE
ncbi:MAG: hydrogenase maturation nickel metallochaperone HypA [Chloroflexi bacterium]|nr:hydrogenase maturation nickel metallochaperone HypA [Chloroflexota bacterium]